MADVAAAASSIATAFGGIASTPPAEAPQSVSLTPFTGVVTEALSLPRATRIFHHPCASTKRPTKWNFKTSFARRCSELFSGINNCQEKHT